MKVKKMKTGVVLLLSILVLASCSGQQEKGGQGQARESKEQVGKKRQTIKTVRVKAAPEGMKHYANPFVEVFYPEKAWEAKAIDQAVFNLSCKDGENRAELGIQSLILDKHEFDMRKNAAIFIQNIEKKGLATKDDFSMNDTIFHGYPALLLTVSLMMNGQVQDMGQLYYKAEEKNLAGIITVIKPKGYTKKDEDIRAIMESFNVIFDKSK